MKHQRSLLPSLLLFSLLFLPNVTQGESTTNLLMNAGFESTNGDQVRYWHTPEYWSGAIQPVTSSKSVRNGKHAGRLTASEKGTSTGDECCRVRESPA